MMIPRDYQLILAKEAFSILKENLIVYLAMEERTGKTLTAILAAELTNRNVKTVNVLTTKKALGGWIDTLSKFNTDKVFHVTNYHKAKILTKSDILILDEAHNYISSYPKTSNIWRAVKRLSAGVPIIYLSATPNAQSLSLLFHQFHLSSWSPWKEYTNFYDWFRVFGVPGSIYVGQRRVSVYNSTKEEKLRASVNHLFITMTRKELGFKHEPVDKAHTITLKPETKVAYHTIQKKSLYEFTVGTLVADTIAKRNHALYCLEGGTIIIDGVSYVLSNTEKIDYILKTWGDTKNIAIMYNYVGELKKLQQYFKRARLLQATSNAEGIELADVEHLIIYSHDYRVSKHTQRRARQASKARETPIAVNFLIVPNAMSDQVYTSVVIKKKSFVDRVYQGISI
jgi:hypothetical protein